jgi:hypothetical protein
MAPKDARRIPGTLVEVRVMVFMSEAECGHRYGSKKSTKTLVGRILSCEKLSTSTGKTSQTLVTIEIDLGEDKKKILTTGLRNVKAVMMENLPPNNEGFGSTGSIWCTRPPRCRWRPSRSSRAQAHGTILFYTYLRHYCYWRVG